VCPRRHGEAARLQAVVGAKYLAERAAQTIFGVSQMEMQAIRQRPEVIAYYRRARIRIVW